ncbi:hypothetical protein ABFS83_08G079400 [Erythranthe nasuta]
MKCQNTKEQSRPRIAISFQHYKSLLAVDIGLTNSFKNPRMANEESTRHSKAGRAIKTKMKFWKFPKSNQDQEWQSVFSIAKICLAYWQWILGLSTLIRKSKKLLAEINKP